MGGVLGVAAVVLYASLLANVLIAGVAIALSPNRTMGQRPYALRMGALVVLVLVVGLSVGGHLRFIVLGGLTLVCVALAAWWTAQRLRDTATFSKWWALSVALPVLGLFPVVLFLVLPPRRHPPSFSTSES